MKLLTSLFGGYQGATQLRVSAAGLASELPDREVYKLLWSYYLNNGLYDELRLAGYFLEEAELKELRNPAQRVVKFYADTIWPGKLPNALPLEVEGNEAIVEPIHQLWKWSNWGEQKQVLARLSAVFGEMYLRVATNEEIDRVFLQLIKPEFVSERDLDERGNITYLRMDSPQSRREATSKNKFFTRTEVWDRERRRVWEHDKGLEVDLPNLGRPTQEYNLAATWGIDFVPFVCAKHLSIGTEERGIGAYLLVLSKIDEANRLATRLHSMLFRHNHPTWALGANQTRGDGRPVMPPRLSGKDEDGEVVELGGERFIRLPGMSTLEALVPNINYESALNTLNAHLQELALDLPELNYYKLSEASELSGKAIRLLLGPAITSGQEVRGNLEDALIRAQQMALTIGQEAGLWRVGSYDDGDLEHTFAERDIIPVGRMEEAETFKAERDAGLPLFTSMRKSGYTEEQMEQVVEDKERETSMNQAGLASALLEAQTKFDSGAGSNGLERPQNGRRPAEETAE